MGVKSWLFYEELLDDTIITSVENNFGIVFPSDYKKCVEMYNGGYPNPNCFDMDNGEQGILNDLLSFIDSDLNIMMFYNFAEESSIDGLVPFARDPFGNLLCFDYRLNKTSPQVIFFDHEEAGEEAVIPVCSTFTELLDGLYSIK
ncbi:SMI1/KNR4 family protein [Paenibacillus riograndensis]|uniref:Knr4/Smi1-like domain-containing protein n=1 Tax=Paenibacillus riograndensis SBR5 TaxID=1073571 RepID=A0A0E4HE50_9BACL|nr:SMI1/KNR4 family protein [Paenibacillus riograndensis]CQR55772.1 hypothetical protein PRIO_3369 [Paenibacillus riograndensis SBR5]